MGPLRITAALTLSACFHPLSYDAPIPDDGTFEDALPTPEQRERCRLAVEYSDSKSGYAVLVLENDRVVCESYHGGTAQPEPHHLYSGTKSFACALAVALADQGRLGLDDLVSDTVHAWRSDPRKSRITVRHLLSLTSGLGSDEARLSLDGLVEHPMVGDKYAVALDVGVAHEPGTHFEYGSTHLFAFGAYVRELTGEDPLDLMDELVFSKIGFRYAGWIRDPAGNPALPYGAFTTVREWAKFGSLLLHEGEWRGQRVLSAEGLAECLRGSEAKPSYGLTFWLNSEGFYLAGGSHNQRLFVFPSRGLLVLRQGGADDSWSDAAFLDAQ